MKSIFFIILYFFSTYGSFPQSIELDTLDLSGVWKFSTTDLPENSSPEINDSDWKTITIPGLWSRQNFANVRTGWYRNSIYIHEQWRGQNVSIQSPSFIDAHEFFFNGIKIGEEGKIDSNGKCLVNNSKSNIYFIPESIIRINAYNIIAVRVCNYAGLAGAFGDMKIGDSKTVKEKFFRTMVWNVSIGFVFLFVSLYHLILFLGSKKDLSYLYFSVTCLFAASLTLGYFRFTYWIFDSYLFHFYFFNSGFGMVTLFLLLFTLSFFEYKIPKLIKIINFLVCIVSCIFLISPFSENFFHIYVQFAQPFLIFSAIPYSIGLSYAIFRANQDRKKGARIIGAGLIFVLFAFIHGFLVYFHLIQFIYLLPESFLTFILCIAIALSAKFYGVNDQLLSMEKKHSEELERKIQERTRDLEGAKKTAEIETGIAWIAQRESQEEKEKTEKLLKEVQKDMLTAQKIQQNILPHNLEKIKKLQFATLYKPVSGVGGDFYDIEEIKPGLVRAFIADATGHGVQAALITMAIKSEYDIVKDLFDSPAPILKFLNENFFNKYRSLNIYFTAFLIDIDTIHNKIKFVSAGHNPQFLVTDKGVEILSQRGNIIGMISDAEYEEVEKEFSSGRLYLFTDGIEEEFNPEQEQFGEERVVENLKRTKNESIQKSLDALYLEMIDFIGSARIRDDITVIGIEYKN